MPVRYVIGCQGRYSVVNNNLLVKTATTTVESSPDHPKVPKNLATKIRKNRFKKKIKGKTFKTIRQFDSPRNTRVDEKPISR